MRLCSIAHKKWKVDNAGVAELLGLRPNAPLDPWQYAKHLDATVLDFHALGLSKQSHRQLTINDPDSWSAMTIQLNAKFAIVMNPSHALTRQRSDLMHELGHIELLHFPARVEVSQTGLLLLSDYSDEQEQEADWFAAALLVPRDGLVNFGQLEKLLQRSQPTSA